MFEKIKSVYAKVVEWVKNAYFKVAAVVAGVVAFVAYVWDYF